MSRPCDYGMCDVSRCTEKDCISLDEDTHQVPSLVQIKEYDSLLVNYVINTDSLGYARI
jgi:hypothetical protein